MWLLLLVLALILHGSLFPWTFDFSAAHPDPLQVLLHSWPRRWDFYSLVDSIDNVVLYLPLGAMGYLVAARNRSRALAAALTLCGGLLLSVSIELLQVYVPKRVCSLADVVFNVAGTAVGIAAAWRFRRPFEASLQKIASWLRRQIQSPPALLLASWTAYQLWPFVPQFRPASLAADMDYVRHPMPGTPYPVEVLTATAEWFVAALLIGSLFGRVRPVWFLAAFSFRYAVRAFVLTRFFALDEIVGLTIAFSLWFALRPKVRRTAGLALLALAIALRLFTPLPVSRLPTAFWPAGFLFRIAFDYGSLVWLLCTMSTQ